MENNEYQTTPYAKYEYSTQEIKNKAEPTASSIEEQYFNLPFKERIKIQKKRIKSKIKAKSQEFKAISKIKSEKIRAKSKEIREKIHIKIEKHKAQEKQRRQYLVPQTQNILDTPLSEPSKFCSECGVQVIISGRFCPGCGATH